MNLTKTHAIVAMLVAALPTWSFAQQALPHDEYVERRKQLEEAYVNAKTPKEKDAIYDDFQKLEMAMTYGEPAKVTDGPEAPKPAPKAAPKPAPKAPVAAPSQPAPAPEKTILDAIFDGFGVIEGWEPPAGFGTGLGASEEEGEDGESEPVVDPIVERTNTLLAYSRLELLRVSDKSEFVYPTWNPTGVDAYYDWRTEVEFWIGEATKAPVRTFSEADLDEWATALTELGAARRSLFASKATYYRLQAEKTSKELATLRTKLSKLNASYAKIVRTIKILNDRKDAVALVLTIQDYYERLENLATFAINPSWITGIGNGIDQFFNEVDPLDDAINKHMATFTKYLTEQAAQLEGIDGGFESLEDLLAQIKATVADVDFTVGILESQYRSARDAKEKATAPAWTK